MESNLIRRREARLHGVGYYAFSTDQQERNRQRDELDSIRESTVEAQKEREALRNARDKLIADRVKAARARQRARQGLPPEEEKPPVDGAGAADQLYDSAEEKRQRKAEEKQRKKKEREERRKDRERADHVRPWDEGKEQNPDDQQWVPAKERFVLSQHEWNDLKRAERVAEFAPPTAERPRACGSRPQSSKVPPPASESDSSETSDTDEPVVGPLPPSANDPATQPVVLPEDIPLPDEDSPKGTLYFTTKKNPPKKELKRRNLNAVEMVTPAKQHAPVPIRNELSDPEDADGAGQPQQQPERRRAEIEPPATFDYYGPSDAAPRRTASQRVTPENRTNLAASIEAGLKFLRNQSDKAGGPGTKNRWTSNADY
uniref:Uncharacterized protein n=1 Tax=Anopheles dirus TaxID=7168 RepID=A0A182NQR4_9DIPT